MRIHYTGQFKKDYRRMAKQGRNIADLQSVIRTLAAGEPLDRSFGITNSKAASTGIANVISTPTGS